MTTVRRTDAAVADLDKLLADANYPSLTAKVELRIRSVVQRVARRPESARRLEQNSDVRVAPVLRYPFKIFYRVIRDEIQILHIHHTARNA